MNLDTIRGKWAGQTVACIASGPSLTVDDCEFVRGIGLPTVVTNNTFERCPWADALYAMDAPWWKVYRDRVEREFEGMKFSYVSTGIRGVLHTKGEIYPTGWGNSGTYSISLAIVAGASRIILLGHDCQKTGGRVHWHGDHKKPMGNAQSIASWPKKYALVAEYAKSRGVQVINCSRETALTCFPRGTLDEELDLSTLPRSEAA